MNSDRKQKEETLHKLIQLKQQVDIAQKDAKEAKMEVKKVAQRIEEVRLESFDERRKLQNQIKRSIWEVMEITIGNRKKVEDLSRRTDDTVEKLDRIENIVTWVFRGVVGLFCTTIIAAILKYVLNF